MNPYCHDRSMTRQMSSWICHNNALLSSQHVPVSSKLKLPHQIICFYLLIFLKIIFIYSFFYCVAVMCKQSAHQTIKIHYKTCNSGSFYVMFIHAIVQTKTSKYSIHRISEKTCPWLKLCKTKTSSTAWIWCSLAYWDPF